jgi:hypothetical protein
LPRGKGEHNGQGKRKHRRRNRRHKE